MTFFKSFDEFSKNVERLQASNPNKCRFVTNYNHREGKLVLKVTDDIVCLQFRTDQLQDVRRLEKLTASFMKSVCDVE